MTHYDGADIKITIVVSYSYYHITLEVRSDVETQKQKKLESVM